MEITETRRRNFYNGFRLWLILINAIRCSMLEFISRFLYFKTTLETQELLTKQACVFYFTAYDPISANYKVS